MNMLLYLFQLIALVALLSSFVEATYHTGGSKSDKKRGSTRGADKDADTQRQVVRSTACVISYTSYQDRTAGDSYYDEFTEKFMIVDVSTRYNTHHMNHLHLMLSLLISTIECLGAYSSI